MAISSRYRNRSSASVGTESLSPRAHGMSAVLGMVLFLLVIGCGQTPRDAAPAPQPAATAKTPTVEVPPVQEPQEVSIAAASDLKFAFDEIITAIEQQHPQIHIEVSYGSSGNFFAQLSNRAPFDLYLSADREYPRKLIEQGLAIRESEFAYAVGHLVLWVPKASPLKVEEVGTKSLLDPSVHKIAIANPQHAPYGRAAQAALKSLGWYDQIADRLVLAENVAQTAQFVETGAAEIGLTSLSLAMAPALRDKGRYWSVLPEAHPPLEQGGVILTWVKNREATEHVRSFLTSKSGQAILTKYGFSIPDQTATK